MRLRRLAIVPVVFATTAAGLWLGRVNGALLEQLAPGSGTIVRRLHARVGVALAVACGRLWTVSRDGRLERLALR
jgi:hypothetical protein